MGVVKDKLLEEAVRPRVIDDCARLVDSEVAAKRGVSGMVIKGGYKAFKTLKPGIVKIAVGILLDDFVVVLDNQYSDYEADSPDKSTSFERWAGGRDARVADAMLGVTDDIMRRSDKKALKKIYNGMRNIAQKNVAVAVPAVARLVSKYVD
jgi:Family of unknown function (DUF6918)